MRGISCIAQAARGLPTLSLSHWPITRPNHNARTSRCTHLHLAARVDPIQQGHTIVNNNNSKTFETPFSDTQIPGPKGGVGLRLCFAQPRFLLVCVIDSHHTRNANASAGARRPKTNQCNPEGILSGREGPPPPLQRPAVTGPGCSGKSPPARPSASRGWCQRIDAWKAQWRPLVGRAVVRSAGCRSLRTKTAGLIRLPLGWDRLTLPGAAD